MSIYNRGAKEASNVFNNYQLSSLLSFTVVLAEETTDLISATFPLTINYPLDLFPLLSNRYLQAIQTPGGFSQPGPDSFAAAYNYQLSYDVTLYSPSAVPVPAAVWLFGTALIGLVGFSKRRKAA